MTASALAGLCAAHSFELDAPDALGMTAFNAVVEVCAPATVVQASKIETVAAVLMRWVQAVMFLNATLWGRVMRKGLCCRFDMA